MECASSLSTHLDVLVTVGTVVDDGERLLEPGPPDADDISNQLTDSNDHLGKKGEEHAQTHQGGCVRTVPFCRHTYLQVCSYERLASRVVKVAFHEEVEKMGGVAADGAQLGVAALEDFIAQGGTHVGPAVKEGAGELRHTGEAACDASFK